MAVNANAEEFIVCTFLGTLAHLPGVLIACGYSTLETAIHFHACVRSTGIPLWQTVGLRYALHPRENS